MLHKRKMYVIVIVCKHRGTGKTVLSNAGNNGQDQTIRQLKMRSMVRSVDDFEQSLRQRLVAEFS